jgi:hypothetical protein
MRTDIEPAQWLLLIHQLAPQPAYLRVKVGRRLARVGAVALKNSVYVLPETDAALEDFQWIAREIEQDGGEASISTASFLNGLTDEGVRTLFRTARGADFREIAAAARESLAAVEAGGEGALPAAGRDLSRLRRRLEEVSALDFFQAPERGEAETALLALGGRMRGEHSMSPAEPMDGKNRAAPYQARVWVTRADVRVDRIASAWLIRRWIDPAARFKFVPAKGYRPEPGEVRFDMFEAEFTHEGDACTFEVLLQRLGPRHPALTAIAELVHDVDLKDGKYGRPEAAGLERMVDGITLAHPKDEGRLERGGALLDDLYAIFNQVGAGKA